jgi:type I restriction enzyme M protein
MKTIPAERFQNPKHFGRRPDAAVVAASTLEEKTANAVATSQHLAALAVFDELAVRELPLESFAELLGEHPDHTRRKLHGKQQASAQDMAKWAAVLGLSGAPFPDVDVVVAQSGLQVGSKLWSMANTLRAAGIRPADYQAYILPALMFKVVSDRNDAARTEAIAEHGEAFWEAYGDTLAPFDVPAGCSFSEQRAVSSNLGEVLRAALIEIEKRNAELAGVFLGTDFAELSDDVVREMYQTLSAVNFSTAETEADALGQAYEYLLGKFADAAGAKAGQFFTPNPVARLLVRLVDPQPGETVYDPTCGSGGLLNAAAEHVAAAGHSRSSVALFGQELDGQSYAIAKVNMFLHGNSGRVAKGDTLLDPRFGDDESLRRFSCVVANPPFGMKNTAHGTWDRDRFGRNRWGRTLRKPSEMAFVAHIAHSLAGLPGETDDATDAPAEVGRAAIVLPMGALFRKGVEGEMRKRLLEAGLVEAVVALPENLFFNTSIPASVLVLRARPLRDGKVLFVDASAGFTKVKKQNTLDDSHLDAIVAAVTAGGDVEGVRAKLVPVPELVEADSDLTVGRWLPVENTVVVDVPSALEQLRVAERAAADATAAFWARMKEAGYVG